MWVGSNRILHEMEAYHKVMEDEKKGGGGGFRNPNVESTETGLAWSGPPDNIKASPIPTKKNYGSKNNALIGSIVDIVMVLLNFRARLRYSS